MLKNLTYKRKFYLLLTGLVIIYILAYNLSIKETIKLGKEKVKLKNKLSLLVNADEKIKLYEKEINNYEQNLNYGEEIEWEPEKYLIDIIGTYCNQSGLILNEFPGIHEQQRGKFSVYTYIFTIEGSFHELLELLYKVEDIKIPGTLVSAEFIKNFDKKLNKQRLFLTMYIQRVNEI